MLDVQTLIAFLTLASLEIVLGIDNIVFIVIITNNLPEAVQSKARKIGLALAMLTRIALLFAIIWVMRLTDPLFRSWNIQCLVGISSCLAVDSS